MPLTFRSRSITQRLAHVATALFMSMAGHWANAQVPTSAANPASAAAPAPPAPVSGGTPAPVFTDLANKGIYLRSYFDLEFASNPIGGLKKGATSVQYITLGTDVDLQQLVGWQGGYFHSTIIALNGTPLSSEYTGGGISAQEANAPFSVVRFTQLVLEQKLSLLRKNDLNIIGGRMGAFPTFARSDYACLFESHFFCGAMYGFSQSTGTALTPVASWGGRIRYDLTPKVYAQFGGFRIDSKTGLATTRLFDFGRQGITGTNWLLETGYESNYTNDATPRHYRLAVWRDTAPRNDVLLNTAGLPVYSAGGKRQTHQGEKGVYLLGDQVVYRPDLSSKRGVAVFGSTIVNQSNTEAIKYAARLGVVKLGTFDGRDNDTLAFAAGILSFTSAEIENLNGLQRKAHGVGDVARNEGVFELAYGYQVTPGVVLRPNLQYYLHPDPRNATSSPVRIPNIGVIGLSININIDSLLNLPRLPQ